MREYGGGVVLAFQNMYCAELDESIRSAISTNTSIKYAASPEAADLTYMARDMRCTPEFLKGIHKDDTHAAFACYVRGMKLQHPFIVYEELGWIDKWQRWDKDRYGILRGLNRRRLQDEAHEAPQSQASREVTHRPTEADKPISAPTDRDPSAPAPWKRK
jgi:hypothetical protein